MDDYKEGCDKFINVAGTNGGRIPCGATLNMFGKIAPYYCHKCEMKFISEKIMAEIDGKTAGDWRANSSEGVSRDSVLWAYEGDNEQLQENCMELYIYSSMPGDNCDDDKFYISVYMGNYVDSVTAVLKDGNTTEDYVKAIKQSWKQVEAIINEEISKESLDTD